MWPLLCWGIFPHAHFISFIMDVTFVKSFWQKRFSCIYWDDNFYFSVCICGVSHWLILLLLLSHFSRVRPTLCDPIDGSHQAPPSLGFSRQEHWSGLPFPSPMHESEKWKVKSLSRVWLSATPWTAAYQAPPSIGFWALSKFHKTTSECLQKTSGTQKSSPLSSNGGRKKYKRQKVRQKR